MKRLALLLALGCPAFATITYTKSTPCASTALVQDQPCLIGAVTIGQFLLVGVSWAAGTCGAPNTVTDGVNPTYTAAAASQAGSTSARSEWYYTIATTNATITANVHNSGGCFLTVLPGIISGQAASNYIGQTLASNGTSVQSCTIAFTRTGTQLMMILANDNIATNDVGWSTTGSTGTFTLEGKISNGNVSQPGAVGSQRVTSGTTVNGVLAVTATAGGMACSGLSINEQGAGPGPQHRVAR